jgi:hypothetical protein
MTSTECYQSVIRNAARFAGTDLRQQPTMNAVKNHVFVTTYW